MKRFNKLITTRTVADPGAAPKAWLPTPVKTSQKRWLPRGAAGFASHRPPDKFLDPLLTHLGIFGLFTLNADTLRHKYVYRKTPFERAHT